MTQRNTTNIELVYPDGPSIIRLYSAQIVAAAREGKAAHLGVPSIVSRAKLLVNEERLLPVRRVK